MQDPALQHMIVLLHDAARGGAGWEDVGQQLQQLLGLDGWHLMRMNHGVTEVLTAGGERVSASAAARYDAHYGRIDPRLGLLRQARAGTLCCDHEHFDARFVARSEFYQDFLLPEGLRYVLGSRITADEADPQGGYLMGLLRGPERGVFSAETQARVQRLMPHLQRAFALKDQLEQLHEHARMLEAALEAAGPAALALDRSGRIRHADAQARGWLAAASPVLSRRGRLQLAAGGAAAQERLQAAIERCARSGEIQALALPGHTLTLSRMPARGVERADDRPALLLCLIAPTRRPRLPPVGQLVALLGLTPAEARLARGLAAGLSLEEHAEQQGVRLATVRTQLKAIFAKTGTHRQSDLVRLLDTIPVPGGDTA